MKIIAWLNIIFLLFTMMGESVHAIAQDKISFDEVMQDQIEYQKKLEKLIVQYHNATSVKAKEKVANQLKILVSSQLEKKLSEARYSIKIQRFIIDEFEDKIDETEKNKTSFVQERVNFYLSPKALDQIQTQQDFLTKRAVINIQSTTH
jgi:hypothetical protein